MLASSLRPPAPLGLLLALPLLGACDALFGITPRSLTGDDAGGASPDAANADAGAASPDAGDVDTGTPWPPATLSGLVLWLAPASIAEGGGWLDRSGMHNDASPAGDVTVAKGAIGGYDAAHFEGDGYLAIADNPTLQFGTGDYYIAVVAQHRTQTNAGIWGYATLFGKHSVDWPYDGPVLSANAPSPEPPSSTSQLVSQVAFGTWVVSLDDGFNDGKPFLATTHRTTARQQTTLTLRTNGTRTASQTTTDLAVDVSGVAHALTIGGSADEQNLHGDIGEVIAIKGPLSPEDESETEAYLKRKYGL